MVTHRSGAPVTIRRVSGDTTRVSPMRGLSRPWGRAAAVLVSLAVLGAAAQGAWRLANDPLRPARWIGLWQAAAKALPAEVAFATEFDLPEPMPRPVLEAEGDREWEVALDGRLVARGSGSGPRRFELPGPIPAGRSPPGGRRPAPDRGRLDPPAAAGRLRKREERRHRPRLGGR